MVNKSYYNTILSQAYSPCGNYLIVGDIYGKVSVFNLHKIIIPDDFSSESSRLPKNVFEVQNDVQINALLSTQDYLMVGSLEGVSGYSWKNVKKSKDIKPNWKMEIPNERDSFEKIDVNCIVHNEDKQCLYVGCSNNNVHSIDVETGRVISTFKGHNNYIHCITNQGNELISGGEDGLVNIWDLRSKSPAHKIEPCENSLLQRPEIGRWIGAVALNDDWLLCGGGPRLSLWHYRLLSVASVFPIEDKGIHVASFQKDKILAGGRSKYFYQISLNGDIVSEIPTSSISIYSAGYQDQPFKAFCLTGSSPNIDICSNLNYRDQVLTLDYDFN